MSFVWRIWNVLSNELYTTDDKRITQDNNEQVHFSLGHSHLVQFSLVHMQLLSVWISVLGNRINNHCFNGERFVHKTSKLISPVCKALYYTTKGTAGIVCIRKCGIKILFVIVFRYMNQNNGQLTVNNLKLTRRALEFPPLLSGWYLVASFL